MERLPGTQMRIYQDLRLEMTKLASLRGWD